MAFGVENFTADNSIPFEIEISIKLMQSSKQKIKAQLKAP